MHMQWKQRRAELLLQSKVFSLFLLLFAFSEILYPHSHRLALRLAFPWGGIKAYHVLHKYLTSDLGSTFRPAVQHLLWEKSHFPNLTAYHITQPWLPTALMLAVAISPHGLMTIFENEASFVPAHFIQQAGY
ncbi:hypothetical protein [Desulfonema limicola]|uniref:hypothetical protein n=1 Tax=Desulfonema limicola TaxID=45656 RepID=UPI001A9BE271|nr:hypothetical protein [Desulfonema limicola]